MSTFRGLFNEIPHISADRFDGENLKSEVLFLSHCHYDHMVGIKDTIKPLYCSQISAIILKRTFPHLENVHVLQTEEPTEIEYTVENVPHKLVVTAFPARHCPGSVMFLFETKLQKVIYTGDFRLCKTDLMKMMRDHENSYLDAIYLDSTFFSKEYLYFPKQEESVKVICTLIEEWIKIGSSHIVQLDVPARYGSEFILIEIWNNLRKRIHVDKQNADIYKFIPVMDECIAVNDQENTQIHCCKNIENCLNVSKSHEILVIRPTALRWKHWDTSKGIHVMDNEGYCRVVYSNHSSFSEIKDFLTFFKTKSVVFNVLPNSKEQLDNMYKQLRGIVEDTFTNEVIDVTPDVPYKFKNISVISTDQKLKDKNNCHQLPKRLKILK